MDSHRTASNMMFGRIGFCSIRKPSACSKKIIITDLCLFKELNPVWHIAQLQRGPPTACLYTTHAHCTRILRSGKAYCSHSDVKLVNRVPYCPATVVELIGICHSTPMEPPYCSTSEETGISPRRFVRVFEPTSNLFSFFENWSSRTTKKGKKLEYSPDTQCFQERPLLWKSSGDLVGHEQ